MIEGSPRILVIKLRYLGDVLLTTPLFDALRYLFPKAFIAGCVNKGAEDMLTGHPAIDQIFTVERGLNFLSDIKKQFRLIGEIRNAKFDMALDLTWNDRSAALAWSSGARKRFSYKKERKKGFGPSFLFTDLIDIEKNLHIVKKHLEMTKAFKYTLPVAKPALYWDPQAQEDCEKILKNNGVSDNIPFIALHPSANAPHKEWTTEGYAALCDYLSSEIGIQTIMICGNNEKETRLNRTIYNLTKNHPIDLGGQLSLKQTAVLLSKAVLFIGIDSGPMHMAAAVNTPVVAIFGPSRPWRWGPWGDGHDIIQKDWPCVPCGKKGCDGTGSSRCLKELSIEEVTAVLKPKIKSLLLKKHEVS